MIVPKFIDLTGNKYGRLTVISRAENGRSGATRWNCVCDCGNKTITDSYQLRKGIAISCGCYHKEICGVQHRKHGFSGTRLYRIYFKMKERCYRKSNHNYKWYGGLGITICDEWLNDFQEFAKWSINNGYADNLTIDRIDNEKGYDPSNCRWITIQEQQRNRRKRGTIKWQMN